MKIICDSCGAKYSIADEKVQGKVFKIRCKKCSEVIVVEGTAEAAPDDYSSAYDGGGAAEWYVVIDGERVGPVTPEEVEGYFTAGQLHAESYIWKDGLDDWVMLETVSEFSPLLQNVAGPNEATMIADSSGKSVSGAEAHMDGQSAQQQYQQSTEQPQAAGVEVGQGAQADQGYGDDGGYGGGYEEDFGSADATAVMDPNDFRPDNYDDYFDKEESQEQPEHGEVKTHSGAYAAVESGSYDDGVADAGGADAGYDDGYDDDDSDQGGMFAAFDSGSDDSAAGYDDGGYDDGAAGYDDGGYDDSHQSSDLTGAQAGASDEDLVESRNENSVLFSLSSMDNVEAVDKNKGAPGQAQGNDKSGLIDIQALASSHAAMEGAGGGDDDEEEFVSNTMGMPAMMPSGSQKSNTGLIVGVSVAASILVVGIAGVVIFLFVLDDDDDPQPIDEEAVAEQDEDADEAQAEEDAAAEEARRAQEAAEKEEEEEDEDEDKDEVAEKEEDEEDEDEEEETTVASGGGGGATAPSGGGGGGGTAPSGGGGGGGGTAPSGGGGGGDSGGSSGVDDLLGGGEEESEPEEEEPAEELEASLGRDEVLSTSQRYTSRTRECGNGESGRVEVRFDVSSGGSVTSAQAQGPHAGSAVGDCVEDVVRDMRFPETQQGSTSPIRFPFPID